MNCPFCDLNSKELIIQSSTVYSKYDEYPVSNGHALIIPKSHCSNYFELAYDVQLACWAMIMDVKKILTKKFNPDGFNIGINIGEAAGQTVNHVHIHLIPRYKNDVKDPRGGVRGVIPEKKNYKIKYNA